MIYFLSRTYTTLQTILLTVQLPRFLHRLPKTEHFSLRSALKVRAHRSDLARLIQLCLVSIARMEEVLKHFPLIHVEMDPGDGLFFHCNLLHSSSQNNSDLRRWVMITSYNQKRNNPVYAHHHPFYHPLNMVPNSAILNCEKMSCEPDEKSFMDPKDDSSAQKNKQ